MMDRLIQWLFGRHVEVPPPAPVVNRVEVVAHQQMALEPNPLVRKLAVLSELRGLNKADVTRALELFHEYYLAELADSAGARQEGAPKAVYSVEEAPLVVIRAMGFIASNPLHYVEQIKAELAQEKGALAYGRIN